MHPSLLRDLYRGPRGACPGVCNPYRDEDSGLDRAGAARQRRRNLEAYLERVGDPRLVLLGEAIGFRGGRFLGIAFTSERQLAGSAERRLSWASDPPFRPTNRNPGLWLEPSGSIVWDAIAGDHTVIPGPLPRLHAEMRAALTPVLTGLRPAQALPSPGRGTPPPTSRARFPLSRSGGSAMGEGGKGGQGG